MPVAAVVPAPPPADLGQHPVGSGPWRFVAWQHDDYLRFARNQDYWAGAPAADTLTVRIIPEPLTRAAEFEAGRLSVIEVPFGETARWRHEHPELLLEKPALRVVYVALNNRRGPLRDVRVRHAINYAVNVPEILATVYGGRGILARGAIPPRLPGGDTARTGYHYEPAEAKRLLARRLLLTLPTLLGVLVVAFLLLDVAPGDPVTAMVGERADSATIARLRAQLHLDDPLPAQFGHYVWDVVRGDLGRSYITQRPIAQDLGERFPKTAELALAAMALAAVTGITLGVLSAVRPGGVVDRIAMLLSYLGVSFPVYWVGLLLILVFAVALPQILGD